MNSFNRWCNLTLLFGFFFIVIGGFNILPAAIPSTIADQFFMHRAFRAWVFFSMGFTFIFTGVLFNILTNKVNNELSELRKRIYKLERQ